VIDTERSEMDTERSEEELFAPYVQRGDADAPPDARGVRMIRLALPERADS
jgi:hypothetical protein